MLSHLYLCSCHKAPCHMSISRKGLLLVKFRHQGPPGWEGVAVCAYPSILDGLYNMAPGKPVSVYNILPCVNPSKIKSLGLLPFFIILYCSGHLYTMSSFQSRSTYHWSRGRGKEDWLMKTSFTRRGPGACRCLVSSCVSLWQQKECTVNETNFNEYIYIYIDIDR